MEKTRRMEESLKINGEKIEFSINQRVNNTLHLCFLSKTFVIDLLEDNGVEMILRVNGKNHKVFRFDDHVIVDGYDVHFQENKERIQREKTMDSMRSPMPGRIVRIMVKEGDRIHKGDIILLMEAMKMEHTVRADSDGLVKEIYYKEDDFVSEDVELVKLGRI